MRSVSVLQDGLSRMRFATPPTSILELGAGDGTLLLRLAAAVGSRWPGVKVTLLDRQRCVGSETIENYRMHGWEATTVCEDALVWARQTPQRLYDLTVSALFLHHFKDLELRELLRGVISHSRAFIAIEPQRAALAKVGSRLIGLLGANAVTREDAVKSVDAGFSGDEITSAWSSMDQTWYTEEYPALPFSHVFIAASDRTRLAHG